MKSLKIDIMEVAAAMESERLANEYFLDIETGDVVIIPEEISWAASEEDVNPDEIPEWEQELLAIARAVESGSSRYVYIPEIESREIYEMMQLFTLDIEDEELQNLLWVALDGKGAFGRFRRVLNDYPDERGEWYRGKDEAMKIMAQQWIFSLNIEISKKTDDNNVNG